MEPKVNWITLLSLIVLAAWASLGLRYFIEPRFGIAPALIAQIFSASIGGGLAAAASVERKDT